LQKFVFLISFFISFFIFGCASPRYDYLSQVDDKKASPPKTNGKGMGSKISASSKDMLITEKLPQTAKNLTKTI